MIIDSYLFIYLFWTTSCLCLFMCVVVLHSRPFDLSCGIVNHLFALSFVCPWPHNLYMSFLSSIIPVSLILHQCCPLLILVKDSLSKRNIPLRCTVFSFLRGSQLLHLIYRSVLTSFSLCNYVACIYVFLISIVSAKKSLSWLM